MKVLTRGISFLIIFLVMSSEVHAQERTRPLNPHIDSLFPDHPTNYLTDLARIVKNPEVVNARLKEIREKDSLSLVVVTIPNIGRYEIDDVAREIGRKWLVATASDFGSVTRNTGGVILLVPSIRKCRVEVAIGSEGYMTDNKAAEACREAGSYFKAGDFGNGFITIANIFDRYHVAEIRTVEQVRRPAIPTAPSKPWPWGTIFAFIFVFGLVVAIILHIQSAKEKAEREEWERQEAEERKRETARRKKEADDERRRWDDLSPSQKAEVLAERERHRREAERLARTQAAHEEAERAARAAAAEQERRTHSSRRDDDSDTYRRHSPPPDNSSPPDTSWSSGGSDSFSGGGGGSEY